MMGKDGEIGTNGLPAGWAKTTVGTVTRGEAAQVSPSGETFIYVDIGSIDNKTKRITEPKQLPSNQAPSRARQLLSAGDVLVSMTRPNLNAVAFVSAALDGAIGSTGFDVLRAPDIKPEYLFYLVTSTDFVETMTALVQGALYPAVRPKDIRAFRFNLAPLPEQARIVSEIERRFSLLDAGVANLKRAQANLKRYRAAVLKAACEGTLVPTEAELAQQENRAYEPASDLLHRILGERRARWEAEQGEKMRAAGKTPKDEAWKARYVEPAAPDTSGLPDLPEGWAWANVAQMGEVTTGFTPSTKEPRFFGGDIPFLKPTDLEAGYNVREGRETLTEAGAKQGRLLSENAVLVTCIGATIGKSGMARVPCTTNQQINAVETPLLSLSQWLYWFLVSPFGKRQIVENASATTLPILNKSKFCQVYVPLPPLAEQERIVAEVERRLSGIDQMEATLSANLKRAERLRQAILRDAFAGKLVPQNPHDEPASALLERIHAERGAANKGAQKATRKNVVPEATLF